MGFLAIGQSECLHKQRLPVPDSDGSKVACDGGVGEATARRSVSEGCKACELSSLDEE